MTLLSQNDILVEPFRQEKHNGAKITWAWKAGGITRVLEERRGDGCMSLSINQQEMTLLKF